MFFPCKTFYKQRVNTLRLILRSIDFSPLYQPCEILGNCAACVSKPHTIIILCLQTLINRDGDSPIDKVKTQIMTYLFGVFKLRDTEQLCNKTRTITSCLAAETIKMVVINFKARRSFLVKGTTRHSRTVYLQAIKPCNVGHIHSIPYLLENIRLLTSSFFSDLKKPFSNIYLP